MTAPRTALLWAAAMIALALCVSAGLVGADAARPFFFAAPALVTMSLGKVCGTPCGLVRGSRA